MGAVGRNARMARHSRLARHAWPAGAVLLLAVLLSLAHAGRAQAASAMVTLSTGEDEVLKGDVFSLVVTVESSEEIGNVEMFIVFDSSRASFQSDGKYSIGGDGLVLISDWDGSETGTRKKYSMKFKAKKEGACKFSIGDEPAIYLAEGGEPASVSSVNLSVQVVRERSEEEDDGEQEIGVAETATSDRMAQLQSLSVEEGELAPDFDRETTEYFLTVPNEVTALSVTAVPRKEGSVVAITGDDGLDEGENAVTVDVGAPNGAKKRYTIAVTREPKPVPAEEESAPKLGIHLRDGADGPKMTEYFEMTVGKAKEAAIPEGYMETSLRIDDCEVTAYMPDDDMESETYLLYGTDAEGTVGFFEYNRMDHTVRPYAFSYGGDAAAGEMSSKVEQGIWMMGAIVVLSVACAGLLAALLVQLWKGRRQKEAEDEGFYL